MPIVNIEWAEGRANNQKMEVIEKVTDVISDVCEIDKERVTVIIHDVPKTNIGIAGNVRSNNS